MDPKNAFADAERRKNRWKAEMAMERDREAVVEEIGEMQPASASASVNANVLDRLTERIADRLRTEIRAEMKMEMEMKGKGKGGKSAHGHAVFNGEDLNDNALKSRVEELLGSTTQSELCICGICFELMAPPHNPILLSPCGHTFCAVCVKRHSQETGSGKNYTKYNCPMCRAPVKSNANNYSLQQLVESLAKKKQMLVDEVREPSVAPPSIDLDEFESLLPPSLSADDRNMVAQCISNYRSMSVRSDVLKGELKQAKYDANKLSQHLSTADLAKQAYLSQKRSLETKIGELQAELDALIEIEEKRANSCRGIQVSHAEAVMRVQLCEEALEPLKMDLDKQILILSNFGIVLPNP